MTSLNRLLDKDQIDTWVVTDGVFSMDGDHAVLNDMCALKKISPFHLYLDDAHGFGILGENGRGLIEHCDVSIRDIDIYLATFGKALGTQGAVVCCDEKTASALIQFARPYIYSTALSPMIVAATDAALNCVIHDHGRRTRLKENIDLFQMACDERGLSVIHSDSAIQSVLIGDIEKTLLISEKLKQQGFLVAAIREPTVPPGTSRLRISLCSEHQTDQIHQLIKLIAVEIKN